jgi:hypothetical protein
VLRPGNLSSALDDDGFSPGPDGFRLAGGDAHLVIGVERLLSVSATTLSSAADPIRVGGTLPLVDRLPGRTTSPLNRYNHIQVVRRSWSVEHDVHTQEPESRSSEVVNLSILIPPACRAKFDLARRNAKGVRYPRVRAGRMTSERPCHDTTRPDSLGKVMKRFISRSSNGGGQSGPELVEPSGGVERPGTDAVG